MSPPTSSMREWPPCAKGRCGHGSVRSLDACWSTDPSSASRALAACGAIESSASHGRLGPSGIEAGDHGVDGGFSRRLRSCPVNWWDTSCLVASCPVDWTAHPASRRSGARPRLTALRRARSRSARRLRPSGRFLLTGRRAGDCRRRLQERGTVVLNVPRAGRLLVRRRGGRRGCVLGITWGAACPPTPRTSRCASAWHRRPPGGVRSGLPEAKNGVA